ncbi:hypothetical protein K438DRAFT_1760862 [Mycena galopus ATCC 62051]|nr:hypothetical protein K438DRAFT_1760862 [Mycena galopus ATCC 62051]
MFTVPAAFSSLRANALALCSCIPRAPDRQLGLWVTNMHPVPGATWKLACTFRSRVFMCIFDACERDMASPPALAHPSMTPVHPLERLVQHAPRSSILPITHAGLLQLHDTQCDVLTHYEATTHQLRVPRAYDLTLKARPPHIPDTPTVASLIHRHRLQYLPLDVPSTYGSFSPPRMPLTPAGAACTADIPHRPRRAVHTTVPTLSADPPPAATTPSVCSTRTAASDPPVALCALTWRRHTVAAGIKIPLYSLSERAATPAASREYRFTASACERERGKVQEEVKKAVSAATDERSAATVMVHGAQANRPRRCSTELRVDVLKVVMVRPGEEHHDGDKKIAAGAEYAGGGAGAQRASRGSVKWWWAWSASGMQRSSCVDGSLGCAEAARAEEEEEDGSGDEVNQQ